MSDSYDRYVQTTQWFDSHLAAVGADQWSGATPCTDWDVTALVDHVLDETRWVAPLVQGLDLAAAGDVVAAAPSTGDRQADWVPALAQARDAFGAPGAIDGTVTLSYGEDSTRSYCDQMSFDALVHGWDLARGIGAPDRMPGDLVGWALEYAQPLVEMAAGSGMFAPPLDVAADADAQTRLLALVGRRS